MDHSDTQREGSEIGSDVSDLDMEEMQAKGKVATQQSSNKAPVTPGPKKGRQSEAAAIFALSGSIESMASSFSAAAGGSSSQVPLISPQHRTHTIQAIEENEELSDEEMVNVADLIWRNTDIADTYLALKKPLLRSVYLKKHLDELV
ncbi:hypothetical protein ACEPAF_306 [Sanghuangporus sanghuang]